MGKNSLLLAVVGLTWNVTSLFANDALLAYAGAKPDTDTRSKCCCVEEKESRLQIGGDYTRVNLKPGGSTSFNGNLGGAQGLYEYRALDRIYGGAKLAWKEGDTHGSSGKRSLTYVDAQERIGYTFGVEDEDGRVALFTGLGYRYLRQKFTPTIGTPITFRYDEFYVPVGLIMDFAVCSWLNWGVNFTWMPQVYPTLSITSLKGARWTLTDTFSNFFVEMPFTFSLTKSKRFQIIINPFYERWQDGHTTAALADGTPLGIPKNTYNFWGVDLNFAFCF